MNELYWIERLDAVNVTFVIILIVALVWLVYVFIESNVESYSEKECIDKGIYKAKKVSYVIIAISLLGNYIQSYSLKPLKGCKFSN